MAADASAEAEYTIYYHPVVGRAAYIEVLFAYAGVKYNYNTDAKSVGRAHGAEGAKVFAVPIVKKGDFVLSQTNTLVRYVGDQLGLSPKGDDGYQADAQMALLQDILSEMNKLKPETPAADKDAFFGDRFAKYLSVFDANVNEAGVFFGDGSKFTTAELTFALALSSSSVAMGEENFKKFVATPFPKLVAIMTKVLATDSVKAFLEGDKKAKFIKPLYT